MKNKDTIAAISTAVGVSAISIVRVCGDLALQIALQITQSQRLRPRFAYLKSLYDENKNLIDRGIVIYFKAPHSFNGLDIVEFQCHGGIALPNKILETCLAMGARMARPGEFSKLALLNNKLDLSQLENIAQLINAQNAQSLNIIAKNLRGDLGAIVETFRDKLLGILAHSEALIDYAEDEISNDLSAKIEKLKRDLEAILAHSKTMQNVINGHKLAIIGRPNVGKSSILNRLLLQNRAIVSETPGTTRDSIEAQITLGGQILTIIDTAGIREIGGDSSKDSRDLKDSRESLESHAHIEWLGIKKSREIVREASIILAVFDNSRVFSLREDGAIVELLRQNSDKIIIVAINKCDKAQSLDLSHFRDFEAILISAKNDSIFTLRDKIAQKIALNPKNGDEIILSTKRQIQCVEIALNALQNAQNMQDDFELFSFHINEALRALALISKPYNYDEMLDKMFGEFCLGK